MLIFIMQVDNGKYSFSTYHSIVERISSGVTTSTGSKFGTGVLPQTSTVDGIRVLNRWLKLIQYPYM